MTIAALLLDVGGSLIHPQDGHFRRATRRACGRELPEGAASRAFAKTVWTGAAEPDPVRFWSGDAKARTWATHVGVGEDQGPAIWRELQALDTVEDPLWSDLDACARPFLARVRGAGIRLAAVSNSDGTLERALVRHDILEYFDVILDSAIEGVAKPEREMFARAAARLGVELESCAFVGDDPFFDVAGSLAAGVARAVVLDRFHVRPPSWRLPVAETLHQAVAILGIC